MILYGDGWYTHRKRAQEVLDWIAETHEVHIVGLIESPDGSWGFLYWSSKPLFDNHDITEATHPFHSALRTVPSTPKPQR